MISLHERLIGKLSELGVPLGYNERSYSIEEFGDYVKARDAAMIDIIALLASKGTYLIRKQDHKPFKVLETVVSNNEGYPLDIESSLIISYKSVEKDYRGEFEVGRARLDQILSLNSRFSFYIVTRGADRIARQDHLKLEQLKSILARYDTVIQEYNAALERQAQRRREEQEAAARAAEERREARRAAQARRDANRARRDLEAQEEEELKVALENGDQETIDRIAAARAERYAQDMDQALEAARAQNAEAEAQARAQAVETNLPEDLDRMSFIYGWLAANVDYMYAKLPGWDKHAESSFIRRFPDAKKTDQPDLPGYSVTPADKLTSGGHKWQLANEYHVHFKRGSVQAAPAFVQEYLSSFRSRKTGTGSVVKGNTSSNAMAQYFYFDFGFTFGRTDESDAERTLRTRANNKAHFELGFNWEVDRLRSRGLTPRVSKHLLTPEAQAEDAPFEQDYPIPDAITASDYDNYSSSDKVTA